MNEKIDLENRLFDSIVTYHTQPREVIPLLKRAIELGLHNEDRDVPGHIRGMSYNIKEYVLGQCKKYRIEIPE